MACMLVAKHEPSVTLVSAIVPAAGASRRMGRPKLLLPFRDTTVLGSTIAALRIGGAREIVLVHAPADQALVAWGEANGCLLAVNPTPADGMLSSVHVGLLALGGAEHLARGGGVLLVCPGDLPQLRGSTVARVLQEMFATGSLLALPRHGSTRGHPLAIAASLAPEILRLSPTEGLRRLRREHLDRAIEIETDDVGTVRDMDTPEDYATLEANGGE